MRYEIEKTGCCERKGMVQIRYAFYLDQDDYGYEKCHVQVPVLPEGGYKGEVDKDGAPVDMTDYQKWIDGLEKVWIDTPFHNHFSYFEPTDTEEKIKQTGMDLCKQAGLKWNRDEVPNLKNLTVSFPKTVSAKRKSDCETKLASLKSKNISESVAKKAK